MAIKLVDIGSEKTLRNLVVMLKPLISLWISSNSETDDATVSGFFVLLMVCANLAEDEHQSNQANMRTKFEGSFLNQFKNYLVSSVDSHFRYKKAVISSAQFTNPKILQLLIFFIGYLKS